MSDWEDDAVHADNNWRNDTERRDAAAALYSRWMATVNRVEVLLTEAANQFKYEDLKWDDPVARMLKDVDLQIFSALRRLPDIKDGPSDTYIGNMAAFGTGTSPEYKDISRK